jgi:acetyl-CoA acetyltransferase
MDEFSYQSHRKAFTAIDAGKFKDEIVPVEVEETYFDGAKKKTRKYTVAADEGPRRDTTPEGLAALKPVFKLNGTVTAGNSSQTSDGAAFVIVMSEKMVNELGLKPIARLITAASAGVDPTIMGIGPVAAIPKALHYAGLKLDDIDLIELNEAFASQSLAVIQEAHLNPEKVNVNGGAIALGHPLGCTGAWLTQKLYNELGRQGKKYGMATACIGGGQGIAGIYEIM